MQANPPLQRKEDPSAKICGREESANILLDPALCSPHLARHEPPPPASTPAILAVVVELKFCAAALVALVAFLSVGPLSPAAPAPATARSGLHRLF